MKQYPNILMVAGNGRNVGKTLLSCRIIKHLAESTDVYAVKISSHFHSLDNEAHIITCTDDFCIVKETLDTRKDSSRMLRAGAKEVLYVQCKNQNLPQMFDNLQAFLTIDKPVIIETGGLYNYINPHTLYYIKGEDSSKQKPMRDGNNIIMLSPDEALAFNVETIFSDGPQFKIRNYEKV
ncbi:hypothetical protein KEM09_05725 [Carboxylicivirga mesophila]|uniref:Molybdopterin-guanine dinucleotide biosynthesis protein B (MobB) domain-containing protein n=1 Tax=Carboxylicivirga mesophila TaxID=1166478 RepID=A0ABS5K7M5_9BACT|nr:hypothetical protein [Carboxylicivirga mesophila]MBS2210887.1 hypothetical protein [Carboxylicivirga mesophila]